jgi:hypothetical protein
MNEEKLYLVTEADLKAFYNAKGRVADALLNCIIGNANMTRDEFDNVWDDNVGGTFEYMLRGQKLRSQDYESLEVIE